MARPDHEQGAPDHREAADMLADWVADISAISDRASVDFFRSAERFLRRSNAVNREVAAMVLQPWRTASMWAASTHPLGGLFPHLHWLQSWLLPPAMRDLNSTPASSPSAAD